jgi:hypothetical protein
MKMIIKLGGIAIGLLSLVAAKIIAIEAKDSILSVKSSAPIQFILDRNKSQISRVFYPTFEEEYYLTFVPSSLVLANEKLPNIPAPSIKIKLAVDDRTIQIHEYPSGSCDRNTCAIASFKGFADRKHTISIDLKNLDPRWYAFDPMLEATIASTYYGSDEYRAANEMKAAYLLIGGLSILFISIVMLAIDPIIHRYKHKN